MSKTCPKCKERPIDTPMGYCRGCKNAYGRAFRQADPERYAAYQKTWHKNNPGRRAKYLAKWRVKNPTGNRKYHLKWKYGLTEAKFNELFEKQKFLCAICEVNLRAFGAANVDHCHDTGLIRGILCGSCNRAIGLMKDDPVKIRRMAKYLLKFQRRK